MAKLPVIVGASVKVMRSYDYCHFEVALSTVQEQKPETGLYEHIDTTQVDELRKEAMRLADKAVEQYKTAQMIMDKKDSIEYRGRSLEERAREASEIPEPDRTPDQKVILKRWEDWNFYMQFEYDYEDDFDHEEWESHDS